MLNKVQIEGIIARDPWTYERDLFFRIASYRDTNMSAKPELTPGRDEPDYVNVRVPGGATSLMPHTRGDRVRIHGFLQSRKNTVEVVASRVVRLEERRSDGRRQNERPGAALPLHLRPNRRETTISPHQQG